ncbi:hypothetical protein DM01DRAFT_1337410 [Hesseltinella vesiculosa]|uniref:Kinetochore protein NDC80 n=1 Tax=Hesseltinella vesiculosa TaxID=101127 RepID=A0A1X2GCQ1_9FUNG|nr:hypothetical protein DM01DRAFT_1337410 [Hesseltinella vesiculosa]
MDLSSNNIAGRLSDQGNMRYSLSVKRRRSSAFQRRVSTMKPNSPFISTAAETFNKGGSYASIKLHSDPRDIKSQDFQRPAIRSIVTYLSGAGYTGVIGIRTLRHMASKDFQAIFKFLHARIDVNYVYGKKKFEDEIIDILRMLKYPLADTISSKAMYSIAAPHSYPTFLALLLWMTDICKIHDSLVNEVNLGMQTSEVIDTKEELGLDEMDMLFFDFTTMAYNSFMDGADDLKPIEEELNSVFEAVNEGGISRVKQLVSEKEQLENHLNEISGNMSPLEQLEHAKKMMEKDIANYNQYIERKKRSIRESSEAITRCNLEIEKQGNYIASFEKQRDELQLVLQDNAISNEDIDQQSRRLEKLEQETDVLRKKLDEARHESWEKERALERMVINVQQFVEEYNELASKLATIPLDHFHVSSNFGSQLQFDASSEDLAKLVSLDLENDILPSLVQLEQTLKARNIDDRSTEMEKQDEWRTLQSSLREKNQEAETLDETTVKKKRDYDRAQEALRIESERYVKTMTDTDQIIRDARTSSANDLFTSRQKEKQVDIELTQMEYLAKEHRANMAQTVAQIVEDVKSTVEFFSQKMAALQVNDTSQ